MFLTRSRTEKVFLVPISSMGLNCRWFTSRRVLSFRFPMGCNPGAGVPGVTESQLKKERPKVSPVITSRSPFILAVGRRASVPLGLLAGG